MKIDINEIKLVQKGVKDGLTIGGMNYIVVAVYGEPKPHILEWANHHGFEVAKVGPYTNIAVHKNLDEVFTKVPTSFDFMDGFSPNLNKHLHIGHASNLVLAKAFQALGVAKDTIAIFGDTLDGEVNKEEALSNFWHYCKEFNYRLDAANVHMASEMKLNEQYPAEHLGDGEGEYAGTKVFDVFGTKVVGIKSDGSTTYFYQDVCLFQHFSEQTTKILYLTGSEQTGHFATLKKLFPGVHHIGLGLVKAGGVKMASRKGNVIMFDEVLNILLEQFNADMSLCYNVLAGFILRSAPKSDKNIDLGTLSNPLNSPGLYLSYTLAKLKSAGVVPDGRTQFNCLRLQFLERKAIQHLTPNVLFDGLVEHASIISQLYQHRRIKDNPLAQKIFEDYGSDLLCGMKKLGMFDVEKV